MTLEGINALLLWVGVVIMGWHEFQFVFVFIHDNVLDLLGTFIVHFVDIWAEATLPQVAENILVYSDMFSNRTVFHGAYNNSICVIYVTHNYVVVAPAGNGGKTASEIYREQVTWFDNSNSDSFVPGVQLWGWVRGNWEVWGWILWAG